MATADDCHDGRGQRYEKPPDERGTAFSLLPIVPPTREKVEAFLRHTDRAADEVLGIMLPDSRAATVWSVAVNGVMAGCRPEYMPVLVALIEPIAVHGYGVEHTCRKAYRINHYRHSGHYSRSWRAASRTLQCVKRDRDAEACECWSISSQSFFSATDC